MKYIDAEKLKSEIEKHIKEVKEAGNRLHPNLGFFDAKLSGIYDVMDIIDTLEDETSYDTQQYTPRPSVSIEDVARVQFASHAKVFDKKRKAVLDWEQFKDVVGIFYGFGKKDSLSEEPEEKTCKTCGFYENNCPFIRDKFIPYPNKVCKDYTFSILKAEQEPVSDDLEEAAENYIAPIENEEGLDVINFSGRDIMDAFKAGAEWQKEQSVVRLSIHDLELLHTFLYAVKNNKHGAFTFTRLSDEQYEEVLRRFNKAKEDKK